MRDTSQVRQHYSPAGIKERLQAALAPEEQRLTVAQLAGIDQLHTRGIQATAELGALVGLSASDQVLDLGCGMGGPARYLADTFGCRVTGVDLSPAFIDAANYLTMRCGLSDRVTFQVGDALHLPFEAGRFDAVFLQHVVMNIPDRADLYQEVGRVLAPGGKVAIYDLVLGSGELAYPVPWARDASTSFLLSAEDTRKALGRCGFRAQVWRDDTPLALEWLKTAAPSSGASPGVAMGEGFPAMMANLARNLREGKIRVLSAVGVRD